MVTRVGDTRPYGPAVPGHHTPPPLLAKRDSKEERNSCHVERLTMERLGKGGTCGERSPQGPAQRPLHPSLPPNQPFTREASKPHP